MERVSKYRIRDLYKTIKINKLSQSYLHNYWSNSNCKHGLKLQNPVYTDETMWLWLFKSIVNGEEWKVTLLSDFPASELGETWEGNYRGLWKQKAKDASGKASLMLLSASLKNRFTTAFASFATLSISWHKDNIAFECKQTHCLYTSMLGHVSCTNFFSLSGRSAETSSPFICITLCRLLNHLLLLVFWLRQ